MRRRLAAAFIGAIVACGGTVAGSDAVVAAAPTVEAAERAYYQGQYNSSFAAFMRLAQRGNDTAQYMLGRHYQLGQGVPKDLEKAYYWYRKAELNGHLEAGLFRALLVRKWGLPKARAAAIDRDLEKDPTTEIAKARRKRATEPDTEKTTVSKGPPPKTAPEKAPEPRFEVTRRPDPPAPAPRTTLSTPRPDSIPVPKGESSEPELAERAPAPPPDSGPESDGRHFNPPADTIPGNETDRETGELPSDSAPMYRPPQYVAVPPVPSYFGPNQYGPNQYGPDRYVPGPGQIRRWRQYQRSYRYREWRQRMLAQRWRAARRGMIIHRPRPRLRYSTGPRYFMPRRYWRQQFPGYRSPYSRRGAYR